MAERFHWLRLRTAERDAGTLLEAMQRTVQSRWQTQGHGVWGIWQGLIGLAASEVLVMTAAADAAEPPAAAALPAGTRVVESLALDATVRPTDSRPVGDPGLYVFRFFDVPAEHMDEVVALSSEAWRTFENSDRYRSRPCGLFRSSGPGPGRMLLVTWYDGFASWESSRTPAPEARERFARRHALTTGTIAYATRLVIASGQPER